jgi:hypothetical protein
MAHLARLTRRDKALADELTAELNHAFEHPEVKRAWRLAAMAFRHLRDPASGSWYPLTPTSPLMRPLLRLFRQHAPKIAEVYGEDLYVFILRGIFLTLRSPWPEAWEPNRDRLSPGHPLIHHGYGLYSGFEGMTGDQWLEFRDYQRAIGPPKKRGPKHKPRKPRRPRPPSIDAALAMQAYTMSQDGYRWSEVAEKLWPDDPYHSKRRHNPLYHNKRDRDTLYKLTQRHIERGEIQAQQKKTTN